MITLWMGVAAFVLFMLYDINSITAQWKILHAGFFLGFLLLVAATGLDLWEAIRCGAFTGVGDILLLLASVLFFAALIYCLFFAIPFRETYEEQENGRHVCSSGVYALCRHPGILCFFACYLFLGLAALPSGMLWNGMVFSLLNLGYAWFQDRVSFPKTFCDYREYQASVPFLIPTGASIRMALYHQSASENEGEMS